MAIKYDCIGIISVVVLLYYYRFVDHFESLFLSLHKFQSIHLLVY